MTKKLRVNLFGFLILLSTFLSVVVVTELINLNRLSLEYNLTSQFVSYRKDLMLVYVLGRLLKYSLPLFLVVSRLGYRLDFHLNIKSKFLKGTLYGLIIFGFIFLIKLPVKYYAEFIIGHRYGLSNQTLGRWFMSSIKSFILDDFLICLILFVPYEIMMRDSRTWWIKLSLLLVVGNAIGNFIYPVVISPLYNDFKPMEDGSLKVKLEEVLNKAEIKDVNILVVDKSKDTNTMNAYMTGLFKTKRIVLWDTTVENLTEEEVVSIVAHEVGHYKENHILKTTIFYSFGIIIFIYLLKIIVEFILRESDWAFGIRKIYDFSSMPLFLLVMTILMGLSSPIESAYSRKHEIQADHYQMALTNDSKSAISAMEKLNLSSLSLPRRGKLFEFMYSTHPNLEDRIKYYENYSKN